MKLSKYHALGNDYLVLDAGEGAPPPTERQTRLICHRNFGIGADGILYGPLAVEGADFGLRIFNPDGSEAEKSGNGLRIFSRYLRDCGLVAEAPFLVHTPGGVVQCAVDGDGSRISVEMGRVSFHSADVPVDVEGEPREVRGEPVAVDGQSYSFYAATIGNPHCVLPFPEISKELVLKLGPVLERHPLFPKRTNVQLLKVLDRERIQIEIWERGAGYTLASGSSGSAAAAVAHRIGMVGDQVTVCMPGGELSIGIGPDYAIRMTGPATRIGSVQLDAEALEASL